MELGTYHIQKSANTLNIILMLHVLMYVCSESLVDSDIKELKFRLEEQDCIEMVTI